MVTRATVYQRHDESAYHGAYSQIVTDISDTLKLSMMTRRKDRRV